MSATDLAESERFLLFDSIANNIKDTGFSIHPNALPLELANKLWDHLQIMSPEMFQQARVGRELQHTVNPFVRTDEICWINGESQAGKEWLVWAESLQRFLNHRLFLGLFSFESHYAHYAPSTFYKKHQDAFQGESNRVLSIVVYLNSNWQPDEGGELVLYAGKDQENIIKVTPAFGTVVVFLSEEFPHEVLVTNRDRYSIAAWFRLNTSTADKVDPPR